MSLALVWQNMTGSDANWLAIVKLFYGECIDHASWLGWNVVKISNRQTPLLEPAVRCF